MSQSTIWLVSPTLVMSCLLVGCGSNSQQTSNSGVPQQKIDIKVTPSTASILFIDTVNLEATGSSLIEGTKVDWVVETDPSCTAVSQTYSYPSGIYPTDEICPSGWLWVQTPTGNLPATNALYTAPEKGGTYHVTAKEQLQTGKTGQAVASITVSPRKVDIGIAPSGATVAINSSVDLQATGSSVVKYTDISWSVQEDRFECTTESLPPQEPSGPCPAGWMWEEMSVGLFPRISATYYSPSTPGTYHVVASVILLTGETGQATATITVIP